MSSPVEILNPEGALTVRRIEQTILDHADGLPVSEAGYRVNLADVAYVEVGAGWRLGNAISYWASSGPVHVDIPEIEIGSSKWFTIFTRSGLGLAFSAFVSSVTRGGVDVTEEVREHHPPVTRSAMPNHAMVSGLTANPGLANLPTFIGHFDKWAPLVGLPGFEREKKVVRMALHMLGREALANVIDHAFKVPFDEARPRTSYFALNFVKRLGAAGGPGDLSTYREAVNRRNAEAPSSLNGYTELVVCDNGCGIAARHSQQPYIYRGPVSNEDEALSKSLVSGASVKPITRDATTEGDPGYGFTHIASGLRERNAFAEIRTGRRRICFNGAAEGDTWFEIQDTLLGYLPGTVLHVVFPVYEKDKEVDPQQLSFEVRSQREPATSSSTA